LIVGDTAAARTTVREIGTTLDSFARARWMLRHTRRGKRIRCYGRVLVEGAPGIVVSDRVVFLKGMLPTELRCGAGAELVIGAKTIFNYGVSVDSQRSIRIGSRCRFGSLVQLRDDDGRRAAPIVIGDDVWLAHGALIEPGVIIGDGSVVAAGAVVSGFVPARMLAFGNPVQIFPLEHADGQATADMGATANGGPAVHPTKDDGARNGAPSRNEVRTAILDWFDETRLFGDAGRLITSDTLSLREAGLLDSLGLVELILMLEARFHTPIDRELVTRPGYQSMGAIIDLVTKSSRA
jgi:acetyltransferase-like isoleucine patch superfamily enzyme/acyl carrier protein